MNHFHIWCNLRDGVAEREFAGEVQAFLADLHAREFCEGYAIAKRELVLAPPELGRFHIVIEFATTGQMERAFEFASQPVEGTAELHRLLESSVRNFSTALYRDFPEPPPRRPVSL